MKKLSLILLILIYTSSTFGMVVKEFYCCGKLASVSLLFSSESKQKAEKSRPIWGQTRPEICAFYTRLRGENKWGTKSCSRQFQPAGSCRKPGERESYRGRFCFRRLRTVAPIIFRPNPSAIPAASRPVFTYCAAGGRGGRRSGRFSQRVRFDDRLRNAL